MKKLAVTVPPFNSTLMGCVRGVADSFGLGCSTPWLYGASGHAFLLNIHEQICPSGPYCWDRSGFFALLRNVGIESTDLGGFAGDSAPAERAAVEGRLKAEIDAGRPAALVNMEYQLLTGYDEAGFDTTQPWPGMDFPPARLSYGSWAEMGGEIHAGFYAFAPCEPVPWREAVRESLEFAIGLFRDPAQFAWPGYGIGPDAYRNWKAAIPEQGAEHGNWWNATVWGECRRQAAGYFDEIAAKSGLTLPCELAERYRSIADLLDQVAVKESPSEAKLEALAEAEGLEADAVGKLQSLADAI